MDPDEDRFVLMVAAEAREFSGILSRGRSEALRWPLGFARRSGRSIMVANGPGPALAGGAADEALKRVKVRAVVSTGFCGALISDLEVGEIVIADAVIDPARGTRYCAERPATERVTAGTRGPIVSIDRVAVTIAEKARLRAAGAVAVEMEAAAVAMRATDAGVPLYCIRSVSDGAALDLAMDFNRYRDREGRFSRLRIALGAMCSPSRIRGLRILDRNCARAAATLGDFLADCRF